MMHTLMLATLIVLRLYQALFSIIWMGTVAILTVLLRPLFPSAEEKLRALEPPGRTGQIALPQRCPQCTTLNESGAEICFVCGTPLTEGG